MKTLEADVQIVSITPRPEEVAYWNYEIMENPNYAKMPHEVPPDVLDEFFLGQPVPKHSSYLECISLVLAFENVSRAFQQQLTRTRTAAYSIQSLRMVDVGKFADEGRYYLPSRLTNQQKEHYHRNMQTVQDMYRNMVEDGIPTEDARGILPLNIHSPIHMTINFRNLISMMEQRLCGLTQEEFRIIAGKLRDQLYVVAPRLTQAYIKSSCEKNHNCVGKPKCHGWVR
jgi:thymidylate synthase (FAD)